MSVSIIYDAQFIKINDKEFIPILCYGANNCTMANPLTGYEMRERDWNSILWYNKQTITTIDEIINNINIQHQKLIDEYEFSYDYKYNNNDNSYSKEKYISDVETKYGWYNGGTHYPQYHQIPSLKVFKNIFINGQKNALTIEELISNNVNPQVRLITYVKDGKYMDRTLDTFYPKTTDELVSIINDFNNKEKLPEFNYYCEVTLDLVSMHYFLEKQKRNRKNERITKKLNTNNPDTNVSNVTKPLTNYYIISAKDDSKHLVKITKTKIRFSYYQYDSRVKQFKSLKLAQAYLDKYSHLKETYQVENIIITC